MNFSIETNEWLICSSNFNIHAILRPTLYIERDNASGQGVAIPLTVKVKTRMKELELSNIENEGSISFMKFRINIYHKEDGEYILENILPVYFNSYKNSHPYLTFRI